MIAWTQVHAIEGSCLNPMRAMRPRNLHFRTVWEHSPTRRKKNKTRQFKMWGAVTHLRYRPQFLTRAHYTRGPSICQPSVTWRPTRASTWTRVVAWPPCHEAAPPCTSCAPRGPRAALPRGLRAASYPCGGPAHHVSARRLPHSPRQHLQVNIPLFAIF